MVELSIAQGNLTLHVKGADKLWALKSSLEIPLAHIVSVGPAKPEVTQDCTASECRALIYLESSRRVLFIRTGQAGFLGRARPGENDRHRP